MKVLIVIFCIIMIYGNHAIGQTSMSNDKWVEYVEDMAEDLEEGDERIETLFTDLSFLSEHPFDLNTATEEMFRRLPFLSDLQIDAIITYRQRYGNMLSIYELKNISALDWPTIELLLPFVYTGAPETGQRPVSTANILKYGSNELLMRYSQTLQQKQGYQSLPDSILQKSPNRKYLGEPFYQSIRYSYTFDERIQAGLLAEKDAGEPFLNSFHKGYDYYSAHILLRYIGVLKTLSIGDYKASFGQGLVLSHDFTPSRNAFMSQIQRRNNGFRRHYSTNEIDFFRGAAATLKWKDLELSLFYSYRLLDATSDSLTISSFKTDGMHRTQGDWEKRHNVPTQTFGGNIRYSSPQFVIGLTAIGYQFGSKKVEPNPEPYNVYYFRGNRNSNISLDYQFKHKQIKLFGETARSANGAIATLNALQWTPASYATGVILYRNYTRDYQAFYGNAFSQNTLVQNEEGLYLGIQLAPVARWKFTGYADIFRFPWMKFGVDAPSSGIEYMAQLEYTQLDKFSMYIRYRYKQKESNRVSDNLPEASILPDRQHRIRLQMVYEPSKALSLRTSIDLSVFSEARLTLPDTVSRGWMISQSFSWRPSPKRFQADLYAALFNTDDYASRIFSYEKNLTYVYGSTSFYDNGLHLSTVLRYFLTDRLAFSTKIGWTHYLNRDIIGSTLETIEGKNRTNLDLMVQWKF
ncbi:MAG: helix-hairpin-helix domain-containing protein [Tannerella sp.]|jgi:hypothetical protein|nr:helix-hairpin-helix domain-containing protein [Tannerella sp.]